MSPALLTPERVRELTAAFRPAVQPKPQRIPPQKVEHRERPSHYSHVTPVESGCMVQLWHSGMYICDIARAIGRDQSVVRIYLRRAKIDTRARGRKISAKRNIVAELKAGGSVMEIARRRHESPSYILSVARDAGIHASEIDTGKERAA